MSEIVRQDRPCWDDLSISGDEKLWRLVHRSQLTPDSTSLSGWRPASGAFIDKEMSVNRERLTTLALTLAIKPESHLAEFTAADMRDWGYRVYADPLPNNESHAIVCPKLTDSKARALAKKPNILIYTNIGMLPKGQ